jgi:hypothetical protein
VLRRPAYVDDHIDSVATEAAQAITKGDLCLLVDDIEEELLGQDEGLRATSTYLGL